MLASWIAGDIMKMFWFFTATSEIPWTFKLCGIFQMGCDFFLGVQYFMYGNGESERVVKDHDQGLGVEMKMNGHAHGTGPRARTPGAEKDIRLGG